MRECKCGSAVANNTRFCPKCGLRFTSSSTMILVWVFGVIGVATITGMVSNSNNAPSQPSSAPVAVPAPAKVKSTGNEANDRLSGMSTEKQAATLGVAVNEGCIGKRAFYMGSSPEDRSAFWSVGCTNGRSYLVQVFADSTGSTNVLDCGVYKLPAKMSCSQSSRTE